jgi:hypothetical protein
VLYSFEQNQQLAWGQGFSISDIARDVYQLIYSKPYDVGRFAGSSRLSHGMGYNLMAMAGVEGLETWTALLRT